MLVDATDMTYPKSASGYAINVYLKFYRRVKNFSGLSI